MFLFALLTVGVSLLGEHRLEGRHGRVVMGRRCRRRHLMLLLLMMMMCIHCDLGRLHALMQQLCGRWYRCHAGQGAEIAHLQGWRGGGDCRGGCGGGGGRCGGLLLLGTGDEWITREISCNGGFKVAQAIIDGQMKLLRWRRGGGGGRMQLQMLLARRLHFAHVHKFSSHCLLLCFFIPLSLCLFLFLFLIFTIV